MKAIVRGWNIFRLIRVGLGIAVIVQGIVETEIMIVAVGVIFGGMAFFNIGCCGANGCAINSRVTNKTKETDYEELDSKK